MITALAIPLQRIWKVDEATASQTSSRWSIASCDGLHAIAKRILAGDCDYIACSIRPGLIWDAPLLERIADEVAAVEMLGVDWICLSADGETTSGRACVSAFFDREPDLYPSRGRNCITQAAGTLYVFNVKNIRKLKAPVRGGYDFVDFANRIIVTGYGSGMTSLQTDSLYPCIEEHKSIAYRSIDAILASVDPDIFSVSDSSRAHGYLSIDRNVLYKELVDAATDKIAPKHSLSFVIRTTFKREHLLRRCIISIDYLRRSIDLPAEIVLATDVPSNMAGVECARLSREFPGLSFVIADGRTEQGYSRVRNLIAGIKKTAGTRVSIIDDDDFYVPDSIKPFAASCGAPSNCMVIFDTQIANEKWTVMETKVERQLLSYGRRYDAADWASTIKGSNSIPLCGMIHEGAFIREAIGDYSYSYDYSEDFILHLILLTHPKRPPIQVISTLGAFQSHRSGDDNVSNIEDRTPWIVDVGNGLHQLLIQRGYTLSTTAPVELSLNVAEAAEKERALKKEINELNAGLEGSARLIAQLAGMLREVEQRSGL